MASTLERWKNSYVSVMNWLPQRPQMFAAKADIIVADIPYLAGAIGSGGVFPYLG